MKYWISFLILCSFAAAQAKSFEDVSLVQPHLNYRDTASLQRGAKYFVNYCQGCHSIQYLRYEQMARGVGIVDEHDKVYSKLVEENLIFTDSKITDPMLSAMPAKPSKMWFGVTPPDLTLMVRSKGAAYVYTYLRSFYHDPTRPWGTNNLIFPSVSMPNVLEPLQGIQEPVYGTQVVNNDGVEQKIKTVQALKLVELGKLSPQEFDNFLNDLVNFLSFTSEPEKTIRYQIGLGVLLFLAILVVLMYLLKTLYWKKIIKNNNIFK